MNGSFAKAGSFVVVALAGIALFAWLATSVSSMARAAIHVPQQYDFVWAAIDNGSLDPMHRVNPSHSSSVETQSVSGEDVNIEVFSAEGSINAGPLHDLDVELTEGTFEPQRQRAVLDAYLDALSSVEDGSISELVGMLRSAKAELAAGDAEAASTVIATAHDLIHEMSHHH